jgi:hypothetical protein
MKRDFHPKVKAYTSSPGGVLISSNPSLAFD